MVHTRNYTGLLKYLVGCNNIIFTQLQLMKTGIQRVKLFYWITLNDDCKSTNNATHPPIHLFFHTSSNTAIRLNGKPKLRAITWI